MLSIQNRKYTQWEIVGNNAAIQPDFHPFAAHMFHRDEIRVDENGCPMVVSSPVRSDKNIPGVLVLEKNRTFGRTENKKRLLYKCIPDNKHLPVFVVPYEVQLGFSKAISNKYILFRFDSWTDGSAFPCGMITHVLGNVDRFDAYTEYRLYCRNIHYSIVGFSAKVGEQTKDSAALFEKIRTSTALRVSPNYLSGIITIDPAGTRDFDDALSIRIHPTTNRPMVSVYIANVSVWIETMGLWAELRSRVSTLYLPDRKIPMLPNKLSDSLCSLVEGEPRFALCMNIQVDGTELLLDTAEFGNVEITVYKNHQYDSPELLDDSVYTQLFQLTSHLDPTILDSHDVVAFWMTQMNSICARRLSSEKTGIFRTSTSLEPNRCAPSTLSLEAQRFIRQWKNVSCKYDLTPSPDAAAYIHMTSPIRRMVDIVNHVLFSEKIGVAHYGPEASLFCQYWLSHIDELNTDMKSCQKIQQECALLYQFVRNPSLVLETFTGVVVEYNRVNNNTRTYTLFVEGLGIFARVKTDRELELHGEYPVRPFLFEDEDNIRQKMRIQLLDDTASASFH